MKEIYVIEKVDGYYDGETTTSFEAYTSLDKAKRRAISLNLSMESLQERYNEECHSDKAVDDLERMAKSVMRLLHKELSDKYFSLVAGGRYSYLVETEKLTDEDYKMIEEYDILFEDYFRHLEKMIPYLDNIKDVSFDEDSINNMKLYDEYRHQCSYNRIEEGLPRYYASVTPIKIIE